MQGPIPPPRCEELLGPLLASLPAAAISPSPPTALLPLLSPILRQRVQLLSSSSLDPWLPLLCYDNPKASKLQSIAQSERLEPHPVSGEVEVDWEYDLELQYKRIDEETLQSLVTLAELKLEVKLIWCVNDEVGGGNGWRIGEVSVHNASESGNWGAGSVAEAESRFADNKSTVTLSSYTRTDGRNSLLTPEAEPEEEEDDDSYWAQYDNTPAITPGPTTKHSPAPPNMRSLGGGNMTEEEEYYAQYATVQPAMDNHDPDEARENGDVESSLQPGEYFGHKREVSISNSEVHNSAAAWGDRAEDEDGRRDGGVDVPMIYDSSPPHPHEENGIAHPRPGSSTGSSGSNTVARLEREVEDQGNREKSEVGIKRHIGASVKSLYRLARVAGIEREEFARIVRTELEFLEMMGDEEV